MRDIMDRAGDSAPLSKERPKDPRPQGDGHRDSLVFAGSDSGLAGSDCMERARGRAGSQPYVARRVRRRVFFAWVEQTATSLAFIQVSGPTSSLGLPPSSVGLTELVLEGSRTGLIPPGPWYLDCTGGPLLGTI